MLPRDRRYDYASRVGVLDFTDFGGVFVHAMFDKLAFPRLKEVTLDYYNDDNLEKAQDYRISRYLQPKLKSLKLMDKMNCEIVDQIHWLTVSLPEEITQRCPNLEEIAFHVLDTSVKPGDRQMTIEETKTSMSAPQVARLIDNFASKLEKLSFKLQNSWSKEIHTAWVEFRSTQGVSGDGYGSRIEELDPTYRQY